MTDEAELRRRLDLLKDHMAKGKIVISAHLKDGFEKSFGAVKYGPDGEIDLATVDGRVRSMAMAVAGMEYRRETKETYSLLDLQTMYFEFIERTFGDLRKDMVLRSANPQSMSWAMSRHDETVEAIYPQIEPFVEALAEFWKDAEEIVRLHLQDLQASKGILGGDLFPSYTRNIASTCGLYLDTIVLTDPFMNSRVLFPRWAKDEAVRFFVKHGLNVLSYKHLALADLIPPPIVITPFRSSIDEEDREWLGRIAEPDALAHARAIFDRQFDSIDELASFSLSLTSADKLLSAIKYPDRLLFDVEWREPLDQQIKRAIEESGGLLSEESIGMVVLNQSIGRMVQANDILMKSRELNGTPLMDAPTSWQYLNWKLEYSAEPSPIDHRPLHVVHSLVKAGERAEWLGKIPSDALLDMRRQGALQEIRSLLFAGVNEVASAEAGDFGAVSRRILTNLDDAYRRHREAMEQLKRKKLRFYGHDIGTWIVSGTIGVAAAITGNPMLGVGALAANEVLDAPKLREIPEKLRQIQKEEQAQRQTPMGLLFEYRD